jgi:membrane associated rhomboid family serine protease
VLGLIGYVLVAAGRQPGGMPAWVRREMASMLASTALLGIAAFLFIDNAAHAGGTAAGAAMGYVATRASRDRSLDPWDAAGVAAAIVLAAGAVFTIARLR